MGLVILGTRMRFLAQVPGGHLEECETPEGPSA